MEFDFDIHSILPGRISVIECKNATSSLKICGLDSIVDNQESDESWTYTTSSNTPWSMKIRKKKAEFETIIDALGIASARAQNLHSSITTLKKLLNASDQKLYTIRDVAHPRCIIGYLKIGVKRLFVRDDTGAHHEMDPLCLLDFYIHESTQRCGFGHELFDSMLQAEGIDPEKLAIDSPSFKCVSFLEKHYSLKNPSLQNNNFVIYPGFLNGRILVSKTNINSNKGKKGLSNSNSVDSINALQDVQIPFDTKEMKSKAYYSSTGNFLKWSEPGFKPEHNYRKTHYDQTHVFPPCKFTSSSYLSPSRHQWGVHEAMHSYLLDDLALEDGNKNSSNSVLPPINTVQHCHQRAFESLHSSWNILGVKPVDYAPQNRQ